MSKFGINMPSIGAVANQVAKNNPDATKNRAGGLAFNITDPSTKLLTMAGGQFFNEPTYYTNDKVGLDGLGELARDVVNVARSVANSNSPQDLLSLAHYLRSEKNIRTTPAVLFAIAAGEQKNRDRLVEYAPKILRRADEVQQAFAAYFALYGKFGLENNRVVRDATLPNSFKKALSAAISKFDEYQLVKYENAEWPRWKDIVQLVERKKDYPVKKEMLDYFITGSVTNAEATPILAARKELNALTVWNDNVPTLAKRAHAQWDMLVAKFGNTKQVWEAMIDGGKSTLPVMAAVRNLRNMEQAGISDDHWKKVRGLIVSHEDNKMMPFRFIAARKNTSGKQAISIADILLDKACKNLATLPGKDIVLVDRSGSMGTRISGKSEMTKMEVADSLAAVIAKKKPLDTIIGAFACKFQTVSFSEADSAYRIYETVANTHVGGSTNAWLGIEYLINNRIHVDRIFLLSDMQCYGYGSVAAKFKEYVAKVNQNAKLISVDIGGYGTSQVHSSEKNVYLSTGYTEDIVNEVAIWEGVLAETPKGQVASATPSMDYVRANF